MNVGPAWQKGYTGKGVVVSILDDGIQRNHPDLDKNYVSRLRSSSPWQSRAGEDVFTHSASLWLEFQQKSNIKYDSETRPPPTNRNRHARMQ